MTQTCTDLLNARTSRLPGLSYKLGEGFAQYGLDTAFLADAAIDEKRMSVVIPFADGNRRDGVGDLLEVQGIDTSRHQQNPIVLFDHGKAVQLPIGLAQDPESGAYTVQVDPTTRQAKLLAFFYRGKGLKPSDGVGVISKGQEFEHALFCEQLFDLTAKKFIRAGSIGYQVKHAKPLRADYETGTQAGLHLLSVLMLEGSLVVLPANGDTVRKMLAMPEVCGKPLSVYLVKSLQPYAPEAKTVVTGGYEQKAKQAGGKKPDGKCACGAKVPAGEIECESCKYHRGDPAAEERAEAERRADRETGKSLRAKYKAVSPLPPKTPERGSTGSQPHIASITDFQPGDRVIARQALYLPPGLDQDYNTVGTMRERHFANPGDRLTVVSVDGGKVRVRRAQGGEMNVSASSHIRKVKELAETGVKSLTNVRRKYRPTGMVRRRLRKSSPGVSVVYVASKDLAALTEEAEKKGLRLERVGAKGSLEKVRLSGDDAGIDAVAKMFGSVKSLGEAAKTKAVDQKHVSKGKSLNDTGTNTMTAKTKAGDATPKEEPAGGDAYDFSTEKHGAQLLRRAHADHGFLMKDYDDALSQIENEHVIKHVTSHLGSVEKFLSDTEKLFGKHYKDYPPLEGLGDEDDKDLSKDEAEAIGDELEEEVADTEEDKDLDTMDDAGNAAASGDREEEAPSEDEVMEGMSNGKSLKAARRKYGRKAACPGCDDPDCGCSKKKLPRQGQKLGPLAAAGIGAAVGAMTNSLEPHELDAVGKAAGFLGEAEQSQEWTDEHRFNSYHYHKTLEGIGQLEEAYEDLDKGIKSPKDPDDDPEGEQWPGGPVKGIKSSHRKMCKDASGFFKELSQAPALEDTHRSRMGEVRKQLEGMSGAGEEEAVEGAYTEDDLEVEAEHKSLSVGDVVHDRRMRYGKVIKVGHLPGSQVRVQFENGGTFDVSEDELVKVKHLSLNRIKAHYDQQARHLAELAKTLQALNGNVAVRA